MDLRDQQLRLPFQFPIISRPTIATMTRATTRNSRSTNSDSFDIAPTSRAESTAGSGAASVTVVMRRCDDDLRRTSTARASAYHKIKLDSALTNRRFQVKFYQPECFGGVSTARIACPRSSCGRVERLVSRINPES
jgi:hypothetical protein